MTTSDPDQNHPATLVQTTRNGRVCYSREQKEQVLDLFEQSGMSGKAFAEQHCIKYPTFALWRRQRREAREDRASTSGSGGFLLAEIGTGEPAGRRAAMAEGLSLILPGGAEVRAQGESGVHMLASLITKLS